jgi:hypothetical protein
MKAKKAANVLLIMHLIAIAILFSMFYVPLFYDKIPDHLETIVKPHIDKGLIALGTFMVALIFYFYSKFSITILISAITVIYTIWHLYFVK